MKETETATVAIIGECMLELSQGAGIPGDGNRTMTLSYGGDTLNTAIYLSRLGVSVDYVTALGDDSMSDWLLGRWREEGVGCGLVERFPGSVPGLYMIQTDDQGERSFLYWRDSSPARRIFDDEQKSQELLRQLLKSPWIYLSGITLALYKEASLQRFMRLMTQYRDGGGRIAFDGNYRPRLWSSASAAQEAFEAMYQLTTIALPTLDDETLLFGDTDKDTVIERLRSLGVSETGLKMGPTGCLIVTNATTVLVPSRKVTVVDTTAAGDSFNAGYLAARLAGASAVEAAEAGHCLASVVIQNRGAIIPRAKMPEAPGAGFVPS